MKKKLPYVALFVAVLFLSLAVLGTGGLSKRLPEQEALSAVRLSAGSMEGMRQVEMFDPGMEMTQEWRERINLPAGTFGMPDSGYGGVRAAGGGSIPAAGELSGIAPGARAATERPGIFDALDGPSAATGSGWGWLADDVSALSLPAAAGPDPLFGELQTASPQTARQSESPAGAPGPEQSTFFERRQEERRQRSRF